MDVEMTVNGKKVKADTPPSLLLSDFIRENLNLTGTHVGSTPRNAVPVSSISTASR